MCVLVCVVMCVCMCVSLYVIIIFIDPHEIHLVQVYLDEIIYKFNQSDLVSTLNKHSNHSLHNYSIIPYSVLQESVEDQLVIKMGQLHYQIHTQDILPHDQQYVTVLYMYVIMCMYVCM